MLAESAQEVSAAVLYATAAGQTVATRSGGHDYIGCSLSGDVTIDVSNINHVTAPDGQGRTRIGAGAKLGDVYTQLDTHAVTIPAGSCFTVGIAGLTLGGGHGVLARSEGLTIDKLVSMEVVTADGVIRTASSTQNADLFWALRGGGNGDLGVVTEFEFQTVPTYSWHFYKIEQDFDVDVLYGWQAWAFNEEDHSWHAAHLLMKNGALKMAMLGLYRADEKTYSWVQNRVQTQFGASPTMATWTWTEVYDNLNWAPDNEPHKWTADSAMPQSDLSKATLQQIATAVQQIETTHPGATLNANFDAYGGVIDDILPSSTAFPHRNSKFSIQFLTKFSFSDQDGNAVTQWLQQLLIDTGLNTHGAYRNYASPSADQLVRFYGSNLAQLQLAKQQYDSNGVFSTCTHALATAHPTATSSSSPSSEPSHGVRRLGEERLATTKRLR